MLLIMLAAFSFMSPAFLTYNNFQIVLQPIPEIALIVVGVTILMISGSSIFRSGRSSFLRRCSW